MKRGYAGDESVWFSNARHMLKAYRKGAEMKKHGGNPDHAQWAEDQGIVRVEVELKRRLLADLGLNRLEHITQEKLEEVFTEQTEVFRRVDMSDEPDILASIPPRYRMTAAAWLAGQDVKSMLSRATAFRHAKVLREYGLDVLEHRDVHRFPVRVRVVDLQAVSVPDWYSLKAA
jgi:II/X family phage/plasmid replication protein